MVGRPALYENTQDLQEAVNAYFSHCDETGEKYTITGLALFLGYDSRQSVYDQEDRGDEFSYIVKRARLKVENRYERGLDTQSVTGSIFALKNMGWRDKSEVDTNLSIQGKPTIKLDFGDIGETYQGD